MGRLTLELIPSKPLSLSNQALRILSKTFEKRDATILEKSANKALRLKFSFPKVRDDWRHEIDKIEQEIEKIKESSEPAKKDTVRVLKIIIKGYRAQADAASSNFLLRITENQMTIEANTRKLSDLSFACYQILFSTIVSYTCTAYAEMGERIGFKEKYRDLLEKLSSTQNED